jgi:hypothetical protein
VRPPSSLANSEPCFIPAKIVPLSGSIRMAWHVLVGQRPIGDVPSRAGEIALDTHYAFDRADKNLS